MDERKEEVFVMPKREGYFVRVRPETALAIIESLSAQLRTRDPNTGRVEHRLDGKYFTIAVVRDPDA